MISKRSPLEQRLWAKVTKTDTCWIWTGLLNEKGYGLIGFNYKPKRVHRVSYELHKGPIPVGLMVCHSCDNRACINLSHLFLGTAKDNTQDMLRKNRGKGQFTKGKLDPRSNAGRHNLLKTHCPKGHPYSGGNLRIVSGKRLCITCTRANDRRRTRESKSKRD